MKNKKLNLNRKSFLMSINLKPYFLECGRNIWVLDFGSSRKPDNKLKVFLIVIVSTIFLIFLTNFTSAIIVGVSPPNINFKGVLRNGYAESNLMISIDSIKPITVNVTTRGEITEWINFSNNNFNVSKDKPYVLKVIVVPPIDMPSGNYTGFLTITTSGFGEGLEGQAVGIIRSAVEPFVNVEVSDVEIRECSATNFEAESSEKGDDVLFKVKIANNGNIRLKPRVKIDIWDQDQISIIKSKDFLEKEILPTTDGSFILRISSSDLEVGQYFAEVSVPDCYSSQTLTFDILELGALKADGVLTSLLVPKTVKLGETTQIIANFKNLGEKEVEAQFKGGINREGKIVQALESEKYKVPVGESNSFNFYFTPKQTGKHVVSGRVFYSNKKTFESSASFEVIAAKFNFVNVVVPIIYAVLIFLIVILFYKINKERRSYLTKFKKLRLR